MRLPHSARLLLACVLTYAALLAAAPSAGAQAPVPAPTTRAAAADSAGDQLRVFLDCQGGWRGCSLDYYITELPFANWMRDRQFADVHVIISFLQTAAGGNELTMTFLGQGRYAGRADTLVTTTPPAATEDDVRRAIAAQLRIGLLPYVMRTAAGKRFTVTYDAPKSSGPTTAASLRDPWKLWTFETSFNGFLNGESQQEQANLWGSFEARRITSEWKFVTGADADYNQSEFQLSDTTRYKNILRGSNVRSRLVRSLTDRWSAGLVARAGRSDFRNQTFSLSAMPVVEYNVFPWKQAASKQLTISYAAGLTNFRYRDTTIFNLLEETRPAHQLTSALNTRLRWGTIDLRARMFQFLHDPSKRNLAFGGNMNLRLVKGLSLQLDGEIAQVRDQLFLRRGGLSNEEILARQSALSTDYRYFTFFGINYTFGSIYNTIVNPRLDRFSVDRN